MKIFCKIIVFIYIVLFCNSAYAYSQFERSIQEIQIFSDRVRIYVGTTYGTCGEKEGWWGWATTNERHRDWLSLVLMAQATGKQITIYDENSSCAGPIDVIGLEAIFLKTN